MKNNKKHILYLQVNLDMFSSLKALIFMNNKFMLQFMRIP